MKKWYLFPALVLLMFIVNSCQKEYSLENGFGIAEGTLQSELGECLPKTVGGIFEAGTLLTDSNYIDVAVNVLTPGTYTISTDTLNGMYFSASGRFNSMGQTTVRLRGFGTPLTEGTDNFIVSFGASTCTVAVITLPEGAGGPATFTFDGAPGDCQTPTVAGVYGVGTPLNTSNTIELSVNVTVIGVYNITTTTVNGISFTGAGTFGTTGPASVVLVGNGTPEASGVSEFATPGTEACSFTVNVVGPAVYALECNSASVFGDYKVGVALDGSVSYIEYAVNVSEPGAYFITGTVFGITFSATGEFLETIPTTVRLEASGTPTSAGENTITITGGQSPCELTFSVDPSAPGAGTWSFREGSTTFSGTASDITYDPPVGTDPATLTFDGESEDDDYFFFLLGDITGGIVSGETYSTGIPSGPQNGSGLVFSNASNTYTLDANPGLPAPVPVLVFTVIEHNVTDKTMRGTFSGQARDQNGVNRTISDGQFSFTYP